jgi:hypothetical protein
VLLGLGARAAKALMVGSNSSRVEGFIHNTYAKWVGMDSQKWLSR